MAQARTVGDRVREARKRRGLTQHELASQARVSASLIRKVEQDGYPAQVRLETLHKLAIVLDVPTTALAAGDLAGEPAPAEVTDWAPVRSALHGAPVTEPPDGPTLDGLGKAFDVAVAAVRDSRYGDLRALLPALLRDADALVAGSVDGAIAPARRLRSQIRQLAAFMLSQTWQFTDAAKAIDLAAADADDQLTAMAVADWQCWTMIRQGHLAQARALAARWADDAEPRISKATPAKFAAWGRLLIRVSAAAVRDNRPGEAADALRLATIAAAGTGHDTIPKFNRWQVFGPMTVAMFQAQNALIHDHPQTTLRIGQQLSGQPFPLPETWNRHRLDIARAHTALREYTEAADVLAQIKTTAPEWLAQQHYARDILTHIIGRRRVLTPAMRDLAGFLALPS
jgi:transcriptional regulator with XRE-family HTH domain